MSEVITSDQLCNLLKLVDSIFPRPTTPLNGGVNIPRHGFCLTDNNELLLHVWVETSDGIKGYEFIFDEEVETLNSSTLSQMHDELMAHLNSQNVAS